MKNYQAFRQALESRFLLLDGSMGALLQKEGLPAGYAPDLWNLEKPEMIFKVHKSYADAGADILITNTFGASRLRLSEYKMESKLNEINKAAVMLARRALGDRGFVAGDLGPCGETVFPTGKLAFNEAQEIFKEQAQALIAAGVDLIIVETIFDSIEFRAALAAVRTISLDIPVIALMTFNKDGLSDVGISPQSTVAIAEGFHVDAVGANCSVGPEAMLGVVKEMAQVTNLPICVQPNAGMPELKNGATYFPLGADQLASFVQTFVDEGASIIGGCCGTTPEYIAKARVILDRNQEKFTKRNKKSRVLLSGKAQVAQIGGDARFVMIGEKINPTGRKKVAQAIREGQIDALLADASAQIAAGATMLDVNIGVPLIDEIGMMVKTISALQNKIDVPLMIDSSSTEVLCIGSESYYGRPLLNSLNGEEEKIAEVLAVARSTGAAVVALPMQATIPETARERFVIVQKILDQLLAAGFTRNDVVFDVLALTVSAMRDGSRESLKLVNFIRDELGCATMFGASNCSFGLPNRRFVHQAYLTMAIEHGLNAAIMNVLEKDAGIRVAAAELFGARNAAVEDYLQHWSTPITETNSPSPTAQPANDKCEALPVNVPHDALEKKIFFDVLEGSRDRIEQDVREFIATRKQDSFNLFLNVMTPAIRHLGDLFAQRKKFIPHLVAAAEAMAKAMIILEPHMIKPQDDRTQGTAIIFATVKGDIHDIGKNICVMMLRNFGYKVVDLGKSVALDNIFARAKEENARIIALSALMTTTMAQMQAIINHNKKEKLGFKILIGGAPVTSEYAKEIGADGFCGDAGLIVEAVEKLL